ncbi:ABC transporter ATP-binding protein [Clostridium sp. SHJSY1]|uniref:ABC transporter ATP-binding protein n=1 Tax=Clostridium sp. SHJSY1 TaxID=2942483 RepID=UPI002876311B|nr:ABC transporter ATP-binding protein [Clostridium sp. SHJSY1]MDS0525269.1 ABC transporter ATP-binding protein [Clostridium sp. SHJSY1]
MNVLEIKNLCKNYNINKKLDKVVLKNLNLSIEDTEFLGIMGSSGSGKTTLLNLASGIDKCDEGEINILNNNICKMKKNELSLFRRKNIGMVFQDFNLLSSLTVKENIMIPLIIDEKYEIMEGDIVDTLADMLDIKEILERYPYEISGGQQQRVAICRAIINNPKIIFADEPTGNLDIKSSKKVLSYFELLRNKKNSSILMVTHDPFSASYCDRVVFLQDGSIFKEIRKQGDKAKFLNSIMEVEEEFYKSNLESNLG